jgi:hypothetical protein
LERELRPIQIAIYKEKEMVDFRRWITALAVLAIFVGLAGAQVPGNGAPSSALTCAANVAVPPAVRSEGLTELIGDILITCTGGGVIPAGTPLATVNITVSLGTNVTSRLLGNNGASNSSEALLILNEAGAAPVAQGGQGGTLNPLLPGFGPAAPQTLCTGPNGNGAAVGAGFNGCTQYANQIGGFQVAVNCTLNASGVCTAPGTTPAPTIFQGLVNGNQVTFNGIPVLPPVSSGVATTYRITNIRSNANGLGGGGLNGTTQLLASISISGSTSLPVQNPVLIAGFVQPGLTTTLRNNNNTSSSSGVNPTLGQCNNQTSPNGIAVLQYSENFGTAFKTRVQPTAAYNGQSGTPSQNVPGTIYNSESGFVYTSAGGNGFTAGLADYGTRLKAVFNNVPAGVRIFVSTFNIATNTSGANAFAAPPPQLSTSSYAVLVASEAAPDANGFPPVLASTTGVNGNPATLGLTELTVSGGSAIATWEVINTNPSALETFQFAVFEQYASNVASNTPAPGQATINMSFAPTPPVPFSTTAGSAASGSLTIPRFADTSTAKNVFSVAICQTLLLFPFVTNQSGFDTGIAIANTSQDPIGTATQAGTCTMTWYDGTGKTPAVTTGSIAAGTVYTTLASTSAAGFQGYMFALCNFQMAHGFAFISDLGARNLAMGYLALIVNNQSNATPRNQTIAAENLNQ